MKIVIVDSDQNHGVQLKNLLLTQKRKLDQIQVSNSVKLGYDLLKNDHADLVFLDIALCEGASFKILRKYKERSFSVVFITDDAKSIDIFEENKLDVIVKPIEQKALNAVCSKMRAKITAGIFGVSNQSDSIMSAARLAVKIRDGIRLVEITNIVRCASDRNYTEIHLLSGEKILSSKTLKEHAKTLEPHGFYRVHQSHLVDLNQIQKIISKDGLFVQLKTGDLVELSRRRKEELLRCLHLKSD